MVWEMKKVLKLVMNAKDLKQIGEQVRSEILKNNFMLVDLMDVKLKTVKKKLLVNLKQKC